MRFRQAMYLRRLGLLEDFVTRNGTLSSARTFRVHSAGRKDSPEALGRQVISFKACTKTRMIKKSANTALAAFDYGKRPSLQQ